MLPLGSEWMLCEDHPPRLAKYVAPHDNMVTGSDCQLASRNTLIRGVCPKMDGVVTRKSLPSPLCFRLTFVCQQTPVEGDDGMFTTHISGMKRTVGGNPTTSCTCITQIMDCTIPSKK